jgi:hypothetical protein
MEKILTPYELFCLDEQRLILKLSPKISKKELNRMLQSRWNSYSFEEKTPYLQEYIRLKNMAMEGELKQFIQGKQQQQPQSYDNKI